MEANRDVFSVTLDPRNKHEYYLKAFEIPIAAGAAKSMMTSYNLVNGIPCTVDQEINNLVKRKWAKGKDFFVVTDAWAPSNLIGSQRFYSDGAQSHAGMIKAGIDSMTQDDSDNIPTINNIRATMSQGLLSIADIDNGVKNILRVRFHTGEFDITGGPYANLGPEEICAPDHAALGPQSHPGTTGILEEYQPRLTVKQKLHTEDRRYRPSGRPDSDGFLLAPFPYTKTVLDGVQDKVAVDKIAFTRGLDQIALKS